MKNKLNIIAIAVAFIVGVGLNNFAMSDVPSKIAVVDINKVVSHSPSVMALKKEQNLKTEELQKWVKTAQTDIAKQSTEEGKKKLERSMMKNWLRNKTLYRKHTQRSCRQSTRVSLKLLLMKRKLKDMTLCLQKVRSSTAVLILPMLLQK